MRSSCLPLTARWYTDHGVDSKEQTMASTVADAMVATLKASGVRRVYGIPGDSLNGFTDALRRDGSISWQHVRHEEAAGFAAAGEAALTGELAVCAASCGPGNLHLINGLFDANRSRVPVLAIAAQIPRVEIGSEYFQETHPQELSRAKVTPVRVASSVIRPTDLALADAAAVLNAAGRVTILAGAGCAGAHDQLMSIAAALQAPVVHAFRGKEFVEYDNPYDVGMTGLIGFSSGYRAMEHCDALLMLGTDFPYTQFYPDDAAVIQVDVRGEQIGRRVPVDVPLVGTVRDTIDALHLGRALRADERQPPADRLFQPRVHGQRAAAGHRGTGQSPRPAGGHAVG
jgi:pyruvate dehydrogenase (quinone)